MNGWFQGSNFVMFIVASHIKCYHLIKERSCSHCRKFFPLRVNPILGRIHPQSKQRGSHENCLPSKHGGIRWRCIHTPYGPETKVDEFANSVDADEMAHDELPYRDLYTASTLVFDVLLIKR